MQRIRRAMLLAFVLASGCGYGEVSPTTYEYAKSLYSISNRKLSDRLDGVREQIATACDVGDISAKEAKWLGAIIENAENERWEKAMKSSRRLMEDQVIR